MVMLRLLAGWLTAALVLLLRATCRVRAHHDPRPELWARSQTYIYSVLHAHQVGAIVGGEPGTGAMVSRSGDGAIIVPALRIRGIVPVRGSSNRKGRDKGGLNAFQALTAHVAGGRPAYLAVDGPKGPRNQLQKGVALLSQKTGAAVLNAVSIPSRRWIIARAWDRLQIPQPFSTIDVYFSAPLFPREGEDSDAYRLRIEADLNALERQYDPVEAARAQPVKSSPATLLRRSA